MPKDAPTGRSMGTAKPHAREARGLIGSVDVKPTGLTGGVSNAVATNVGRPAERAQRTERGHAGLRDTAAGTPTDRQRISSGHNSQGRPPKRPVFSEPITVFVAVVQIAVWARGPFEDLLIVGCALAFVFSYLRLAQPGSKHVLARVTIVAALIVTIATIGSGSL